MASLFLVVSKVGWTLAKPETWFLLLVLLALWAVVTHRQRIAVASLSLFCALFLVVGIWPVGALVMRPLEDRFPIAPDIPRPGLILVLGGAEIAGDTAASGLVSVSHGAERFLEALNLARRYPQAKLGFTGGTGWFVAGSVSGADVAGRLFREAGIAPERLVLEGRSRNTWQNAVFTHQMLDDDFEGPVLIVTSAFHMARSVGVFCAAGWRDFAAWPVDHRAQNGLADRGWWFARNLETLNTGAKEWLGLAAYSATGRHTGFRVAPDGTIACG